MQSRKNTDKGHVLAGKSILLVDDENFLDQMACQKEFSLLLVESKKIIGMLRKSLHNT